jgi:hypothetical protein
LSRKAVHSWVANVSLMTKRLKRGEGSDETDALVKRRDKCINVGGGYVDKYMFPRFEYHMFYVLYPFVTDLLTLPGIFGSMYEL